MAARKGPAPRGGKTFQKTTRRADGKSEVKVSNRKGASIGKVIRSKSGVIGRSSPGRVTTFHISSTKAGARAGGSKG